MESTLKKSMGNSGFGNNTFEGSSHAAPESASDDAKESPAPDETAWEDPSSASEKDFYDTPYFVDEDGYLVYKKTGVVLEDFHLTPQNVNENILRAFANDDRYRVDKTQGSIIEVETGQNLLSGSGDGQAGAPPAPGHEIREEPEDVAVVKAFVKAKEQRMKWKKAEEALKERAYDILGRQHFENDTIEAFGYEIKRCGRTFYADTEEVEELKAKLTKAKKKAKRPDNIERVIEFFKVKKL